MIGPRLELLGLCGVVLTLPFYLFAWNVGGQSVSPTELAMVLAAGIVGAQWAFGRARGAGAHPILPPGGPHPRPLSYEERGDRPPLPLGEGWGEGVLPLSAPEMMSAEPIFAPRSGRGGEVPGVGGEVPRVVGEGVIPGWRAFDAPIIVLLLAALLSLLATEYLRLSFRELRTLIVEPILFWYLCRAVLRSPADAGLLVATLGGVTALVAVVGLAQLVLGGAVTDIQGVRRVLGTYTSPNHFALLLGRTLPFLVAIAWIVPRWRPWAAGGAVLCAGALLATFSVGGWLGTALGLLVVIGFAGGRRAVLALAVAGVVVAVVIFAAVPVERLAGRLDPRQGTSFVRVQLWQAAVELVEQSPVLGIGLDNFLYRYPTVMPPNTTFEPNLSHPHNLILQFWLQLGILGVVALGWLLWLFGRLACPAAHDATGPPLERALATGALGSMTDFVAHGLVDNSYFLPDMAIIFWLTLAVAASLSGSTLRGDTASARPAT